MSARGRGGRELAGEHFDAGIGWSVKSSKLKAGSLSWMEESVLRTHQWTARKLLEAVG